MVGLGLGFKEGVSVRIRVGLRVRIVLVRVGGLVREGGGERGGAEGAWEGECYR